MSQAIPEVPARIAPSWFSVTRTLEWEMRRVELLKHFVTIEATVLGLTVGLAASSPMPLDGFLKAALLELTVSLAVGCIWIYLSHMRLSDYDRFVHSWNDLQARIQELLRSRTEESIARASALIEQADAAHLLFGTRMIPEVGEIRSDAREELSTRAKSSQIPRDLLMPRTGAMAVLMSDRSRKLIELFFFATGLASVVAMLIAILRR